MKLTPISVAWVFAASFYAAASGFIPNPLLGPDGLFVANTAHNIVHLMTAVGFTVVALAGSKASVVFMQAFGVIYLVTGAIGFLATGRHGGDGHLLGLVHINTLDNFLHLVLGFVIGVAGWHFHARSASVRPSMAIHQHQDKPRWSSKPGRLWDDALMVRAAWTSDCDSSRHTCKPRDDQSRLVTETGLCRRPRPAAPFATMPANRPERASRRAQERAMTTAMTTMVQNAAHEQSSMSSRTEAVGRELARYGLVVVVGWIGLMKFRAYEAEGIRLYVANSPLRAEAT